MRQATFRIAAGEGLAPALAQIRAAGLCTGKDRSFVIVAQNLASLDDVERNYREAWEALPDCQVVGATMLGQLNDHADVPTGTSVSVVSLDSSRVVTLRYDCSLMTPEQAGQRLSEDLRQIPDAKCVLFFSAGIMPDRMLFNVSHEFDDIPIFGVPAGSHIPSARQTRVALDGTLLGKAVVCLVLRGSDLRVLTGLSFGWTPFGKRMHVTGGDGVAVVDRVDNVTPGALYKRYLHLDAGQSGFADAYAFPLVTGAGESLTARVPLYSKPDGGFVYANQMPVGESVSLSYARESDLLRKTLDLANQVASFQPEAVFSAYCENRTIFLGNELSAREVGYLKQAAPQGSIYYGFGELLRKGGSGGYRNNTITTCALREGDAVGDAEPVMDLDIESVSTSNRRLTALLVNFLEEATKDLERIADYDEMTGLMRRSAMERWVDARLPEVRQGNTLSAFMFDVDLFKSVNDNFGHLEGDRVLVSIADAVRDNLEPDAVACHWGGDEFLCARLGSDEEWARACAERVRAAVEKGVHGRAPRVTISVGVGSVSGADADPDVLLRCADRAMYHSKHMGGNRVTVYSPEHSAEMEEPTVRYPYVSTVRQIVEGSPFATVAYRPTGGRYEVLAVSDGYCRMLGASREELGRYLSAWSLGRVHPDDARRVEEYADNLGAREGDAITYRLLVNGEYHRILACARMQSVGEGGSTFLVLYVDLSGQLDDFRVEGLSLTRAGEPAKTAMGLEELVHIQKLLLEDLRFPLALFDQDSDGYRCLLVSQGASDLFGVSRELLRTYLTNKSYSRTHPDDAGILLDAGEHLFDRGDQAVVVRMMVHNSDQYHRVLFLSRMQIMATGKPLQVVYYVDLDEAGSVYDDARDRFLQEERDNLYKDRLTGLPNVNYFHVFAQGKVRQIRSAGAVPAVVFLDVRNMRAYNERNGFAKGDQLLVAASREVLGAFPNDLVVRYTEDHFVVVAPAGGIEDGVRSAQAALARRVPDRLVDLCAGVYVMHEEDVKVPHAVDRARLASSLAGRGGSDSCRLYDEEVADYFARRDYVLDNWRTAIDRRWIRPYFQPVVGSLSQKIVSFEALARWQDPERGLIPPDGFIPTLEKSGLVCDMDMEILRQVCELMGSRLRWGLPCVPVSVNLSRVDLTVADLHERVNGIISSHGIPRGKIAFEITETALVEHGERVHEHVRRFHEDGFEVYLDDFGSGQSSLNTLQSFDFDVLKMDMSFLRHANKKTPAILSDMIDMGKRLGMVPLSEGVETDADAQMLIDMGCSLLQGYHYSRPLPADELAEAIAARGLALETAEERELFSDLAHVNVLDVREPVACDPPLPRLERNPTIMVLEKGDRLEVIYRNMAARAVCARMGMESRPVFEDFVNGRGRTVVTAGLRQSDGVAGLVPLEVKMADFAARVYFQRISARGLGRAYLVTARDVDVKG